MNKYKIITIVLFLFVRIGMAQNVGVNVKPADSATLDVNGDLRVGKISEYNNKAIPVVVDEKGYLYQSGDSKYEIEKITEKEENEGTNTKLVKKPFISIRIKARTNSMDEDKISNLDTKIDADKYTVALLGSYFRYEAWDSNSVPRNEKHYAMGLTSNNKAPQLDADAFVENNTWRVKMDYVGGTPVYDYFKPNSTPDVRYFYWDIHLLVVKNIYMRDLGVKKVNTSYQKGFGYVGSAEKSPLP